jgi:2Fe-2S ferredoxin
MPNIVYVDPSNERRTIDLTNGTSVMHGAIAHGIAGIVAECGGNAMCATCHVYVEPSQFSNLPAMSDEEDALLDSVAAERRPNSRLSA